MAFGLSLNLGSPQRGTGGSSEVTFTDDISDDGATPMALTSPSITGPYVFQRGRSNVTLSGTYDLTGDPTGIAWRVGSGAWRQLTSETIGGGSWSGTMSIPSNYLAQGNLEIKPINGENVTPESIADVAVTAVIIASGQSNVDGVQVDTTQTYTPAAFDYYQRETTGAWVKTTSDMTLWPALAAELQDAGVPPAIYLPVTSPGTGYVDGAWVRTTGPRYNDFVTRVTAFTNETGGVEANLRIQGEQETPSVPFAEVWDDYFEDMKDGFVSEIPNLRADDPWFIGLTVKEDVAQADVQAAQMRAIDDNPWAHELLNVIDETMGDGVHYGSVTVRLSQPDAEAQMLWLAGRMARNITPLILGTGTPEGSPVVVSHSVSGDEVTITFDRDMANHTDADGWVVVDDSGTRTVTSAAQGATAADVVLTLDQVTYGDVFVSFGNGEFVPDATLQDTGTYPFPPRPIIDDLAGVGAGAAPSVSTAPSLSGVPQVGLELTGVDGTYDGVPAPTVGSYQWQISDDGSTGWSDISGATSANYTPVTADENKYVRRQETATNAIDSTTQATAASAQIAEEDSFAQPSDNPAVTQWWSATAGVTEDGGTVLTWDNQIGTGETLSRSGGFIFGPTSGTRTLNSLNVLDFDGADDRLIGSALPGVPSFTIRANNAASFYGELQEFDGDFTTASASSTSRDGAGLWEVEFDADADTATLRLDGTQIAQATDYTGSDSAHVFMVVEIDGADNANDAIMTNFVSNYFRVMRHGGTQCGDGGVAEVVVCDAVQSGDDLTNMRNYLNTRWGL